jgi:hypothetical protein
MTINKSFLFLSGIIIALLMTNAFANEEHYSHMQNILVEDSSSPSVKITVKKITQEQEKKNVQIQLQNIKDGSAVTLNDLQEVHTQKIHLMIINETLEDYIHLHPEPTSEPGVYQFTWQPNTAGNYKIWADLLPLKSQQQEYISTMLLTAAKKHSPLAKTIAYESKVNNYTFRLSFDQAKLKAGSMVMGEIKVSDAGGNPVKKLQPIMGAFAHIVGFTEDFNHMVHLHPLGAEPSKASDLGGSVLQFHFAPKAPGFIKLFAQVRIAGKEIYVPFGIQVDR